MNQLLVIYLCLFVTLSFAQDNITNCDSFFNCEDCVNNPGCSFKIYNNSKSCISTQDSNEFSFWLLINHSNYCIFQYTTKAPITTNPPTEPAIDYQEAKTLPADLINPDNDYDYNSGLSVEDEDELTNSNVTRAEKETIPNKYNCSEWNNLWTFLGGLFIGIGIMMISYWVRLYSEEKRRSPYSQSYPFDNFVNP